MNRVSKMSTFLFKIGGNALSDAKDRRRFCDAVSTMIDSGTRVIIVHGGGPEINKALEMKGIQPKKVNGLRVTDKDTLDVVEGTLSSINGSLVRSLKRSGVKALGVPGCVVALCKRKEPSIVDGTAVDLMYVGDVSSVDIDAIEGLFDNGITPVIYPIGADENGDHLNINADSMASGVASALRCDEMVQITDVPGVLMDVKDPSSKIDEMTLSEVDELIKKGIISGGMIPKVEACREALSAGVEKVRMMNGKDDRIIISDIMSGSKEGTIIRRG